METKAVNERATPQRRCIASGRVMDKEAMVRFVADPQDRIFADVENRLPGRGLWLSAKRDVVNTACSKRLFAKAARRKVTTPDDLADVVERLLVRRCLDLIGLARRAGEVTAGYEKVRAALKQKRRGLLLEAADGAADGRNKITGLAPDLPVIDLFDGAELGGALGRERTVHAVVAPGRLAERLLEQAGRLAGFRLPATDGNAGELEAASEIRNADG